MMGRPAPSGWSHPEDGSHPEPRQIFIRTNWELGGPSILTLLYMP